MTMFTTKRTRIIRNTVLLVKLLEMILGSGMWCCFWNLWHCLGSRWNEAQIASNTLSGVNLPLNVIPLITS